MKPLLILLLALGIGGGAIAGAIINSFRFRSQVTQNFDGYTPAASLADQAGWTVPFGSLLTESGGTVTGNTNVVISIASYEPSPFTTAANHQVECTFAVGIGTENAHGVAAAIQVSGECYHLFADPAGNIYFGYGDGAGNGSDYLSTSAVFAAMTDLSLRLTVSGTGTSRVATAEYNVGAGWVIPSGWDHRDFGVGKRLDGGKAGLAAYTNLSTCHINSVIIRNQ